MWFKTMELIQEPGQDLASALRKFHSEKNILELPSKACKCHAEEFNTMVHGDAWFNNFMFRFGSWPSIIFSCGTSRQF